MPTYKYSRTEGNAFPCIYFNGRTYYENDTFETPIYLSQNTMEVAYDKLELVSDEPYITPIIASTGQVTGDSILEIPDVNWAFDIYITTADADVALVVGFNGNASATNKIYIPAGFNGPISKMVTGRSIRTIDITATGDGAYSVYCIRVEKYNYTDLEGI